MEWASRTHRFAFTSTDFQSRMGLEASTSQKRLGGSGTKRVFSLADTLVKVARAAS